MKIELTVKREFEAKYLLAEVGARYWEDSSVDEVEDTDGDLIPCRVIDYWKPLILLETGQIVNWKKGVTASIHYKSCDDNTFKLLDEDHVIIKEIDGYVIKMMCPKRNGYGDYVIMEIDEDGFIQDFEVDFNEFNDSED
jgi:hypothetical protein